MKERTFNSHFPIHNEIWASKVLGVPHNNGYGPDLISENVLVEVKSRNIDKRKYLTWTVLEHQVNYPETYQREGIWAFITYNLSKEISELTNPDFSNGLCLERQLYIIDWDFINNFPPRRSKGKTNITEWDRLLRYPKGAQFPKLKETTSNYKSYKVMFSQDVNLSLLPNLKQ